MEEPAFRSPFISRENVHLTLEGLIYHETSRPTETPNPLLYLQLVDELLLSPEFPPSAYSRSYILDDILTSIIAEQFNIQRRIEGLPPIDGSESRKDVELAIAADVATQAPDLIAWSLLYHRYVRADLNITVPDYSKLGHFSRRTGIRYQNAAVDMLTHLLIEQEWQTRKKHFKRRLLNSLSNHALGAENLPGRDREFARIKDLLRSSQPPKHFYISGSPGIGKTTFVKYLVSDMLEADTIVDLCWIKNPLSVQRIYDEITLGLLREREISLPAYLNFFPIGIVIDGVDELVNKEEIRNLHTLLAALELAIVFFIGNKYQERLHISSFRLTQLDEATSKYLSKNEIVSLGITDENLVADYVNRIWQQAAGNPRLIQLTARQLLFSGQVDSGNQKIDIMYKIIENMLSPQLRYIWYMFFLMTDRAISPQDISSIWAVDALEDEIGQLAVYGIIETSAKQRDQYWLPSSARIYQSEQYRTQREVKKIVAQLGQTLLQTIETNNEFSVECIEYLLVNEQVVYDLIDMNEVGSILHRTQIERRYPRLWLKILKNAISEKTISTNWNIKLMYADTLRRNREWSAAEVVLRSITEEAGNAGEFVMQSHALYQMALISRYYGRYEFALDYLQQASRTASFYSDDALQHRVDIELSQISIDTGDIETALDLLEKMPPTRRVVSLIGEAYLSDGQAMESCKIAQEALHLDEGDDKNLAAIHDLLGRCYFALNDIHNARQHFSIAVTLFELSNDFFGLARTQSNLAALFVQTNNLIEAQQLMLRVQDLQMLYNDNLGLFVTRHNFQFLRTYWVGQID